MINEYKYGLHRSGTSHSSLPNQLQINSVQPPKASTGLGRIRGYTITGKRINSSGTKITPSSNIKDLLIHLHTNVIGNMHF